MTRFTVDKHEVSFDYAVPLIVPGHQSPNPDLSVSNSKRVNDCEVRAQDLDVLLGHITYAQKCVSDMEGRVNVSVGLKAKLAPLAEQVFRSLPPCAKPLAFVEAYYLHVTMDRTNKHEVPIDVLRAAVGSFIEKVPYQSQLAQAEDENILAWLVSK